MAFWMLGNLFRKETPRMLICLDVAKVKVCPGMKVREIPFEENRVKIGNVSLDVSLPHHLVQQVNTVASIKNCSKEQVHIAALKSFFTQNGF